MAPWEHVIKAKHEKRHELLMVGKDLEESLSLSNGLLNPEIFMLSQLNYLRLSSSSLSEIPEDIENLINLSNLELQNNKLTTLPKTIGKLKKLKLLDISDNQLDKLPDDINNLTALTLLNIRNNNIEKLITFENCTSLSQLDIRVNKISNLEEICHDKLQNLYEIQASSNKIVEIPSELSNLSALKILNLSENMITIIDDALLHCVKLKEINLKGNPLNDKRLKKLVESDRGFSRTILDYIRQHSQESKGMSKSKNKKEKNKKVENTEIESLCDKLSVLSAKEDFTVIITDDMKEIRGYIVCCILRNMDLSGSKMKTFISIQNKLHETLCEKRVAATIATHDLSKILSPMTFCSRNPTDIMILPLNKNKIVPATDFFKTLQEEAENMRKKLKRNTYSGIHKYLYLMERWEKWPCLLDSEGKVISLPPITNTDYTKITPDSSDVFVEVTSGLSLNKAKEVVDALIIQTLEANLTKEKGENGKNNLIVEQIKILHQEGGLKMVYPSRTDLNYDSNYKVNVVRPHN